jgi:hypothetical protein
MQAWSYKVTNRFKLTVTFILLVESLQEIIRHQSGQSRSEFGPYSSHEADTRRLIFPILLDTIEQLKILGEAKTADTSQFSVRVRQSIPHNLCKSKTADTSQFSVGVRQRIPHNSQ